MELNVVYTLLSLAYLILSIHIYKSMKVRKYNFSNVQFDIFMTETSVPKFLSQQYIVMSRIW